MRRTVRQCGWSVRCASCAAVAALATLIGVSCSRTPLYSTLNDDAGVELQDAFNCDAPIRAVPPVDIIWVVDQSSSMDDEILQVKANINGSFVSILEASGLDYRVVMIAERGKQGLQICVEPPLGTSNFDCDDNPPRFRSVSTPVASTDALQLLLSTYDSVDVKLNWSATLRQNALKVIIVVTDDDSGLPSQPFEQRLLSKMPAGIFGTSDARNYKLYGIVGIHPEHPWPSKQKCSTAVNNGSVYQLLSVLTDGALYPVCADDYSPIFESIAEDIAATLTCSDDAGAD